MSANDPAAVASCGMPAIEVSFDPLLCRHHLAPFPG